MTRAEQRERKRTAYHEAGHAVVGALYGAWPYRATIAADEANNIRGEVRRMLPGTLYHQPHRLTAAILFGLAGIPAQDRYDPKGDSEYTGGGADVECAYENISILSIATDGQCQNDKEVFQEFADDLVGRYWYAIDTFAKALLEHETLEDEELEQVLHSAIFTDAYADPPTLEELCYVDQYTMVDLGRDILAEAKAARASFEARWSVAVAATAK